MELDMQSVTEEAEIYNQKHKRGLESVCFSFNISPCTLKYFNSICSLSFHFASSFVTESQKQCLKTMFSATSDALVHGNNDKAKSRENIQDFSYSC